ncbi:MAG: RHS repeat protein, partial [Casimicrobium sp.]
GPEQDTTIGRNNRDLITRVQQGTITRTYDYNSQYYLISIVDPETGTTTFGRDGNGNMTSRKVGSSGTTTYTYDDLDRQTQAVYPGGPTINKTYNARGKVLTTTVSGTGGDRSYSYDANDNLDTESVTIDGRTFTIGYAYNGLDQLSSITYPTGRVVAYAPNTLGRPTQTGSYLTAVSSHESGQVNAMTYGNSATSTYGQNARLWPSSFVATKNSNFINSAYTYDGTGNLTRIEDSVDNGFDRVMDDDGSGRLTGADGPWGNGTFTYDGVGNITQATYGSLTRTYTYNSTSNLLTSLSGMPNPSNPSTTRSTSYTYGAYGQVLRDGPTTGLGSEFTNTFDYDDVPNLTCINCADALKKIAYRYDGNHHRVAREKIVTDGVTNTTQITYEVHDAMGR